MVMVKNITQTVAAAIILSVIAGAGVTYDLAKSNASDIVHMKIDVTKNSSEIDKNQVSIDELKEIKAEIANLNTNLEWLKSIATKDNR